MFEDYLKSVQTRVQTALQTALPEEAEPAAQLKAAMTYSVLNGGKRVRAALVYATAECLQARSENNVNLDAGASAIEMMHAYSLVHDDLPAMDDDDLRRGQATCHIAYDEATAILAGDALQALAYEQILTSNLSHELKSQVTLSLIQASGVMGMVGGQALDLAGEHQGLALQPLEQIHSLKTGALINCSVEMAALICKATLQQRQQLQDYSNAIGLAFQVKDDILDIEGSTEELGKPQGADQALQKSTYPALLGLQGAKDKLQTLHEDALQALSGFSDSAQMLRELADFIVLRRR